jgi:hypothetical protein
MTQFATNGEFAARMGLTLNAAEQTRVDTLLALASGLIQQETGQKIASAFRFVVDDDARPLSRCCTNP